MATPLVRHPPAWLKPSAIVDLRQVLASLRPAIRTEIASVVSDVELGRWCRGLGLYGIRDGDGFLVLSRHPGHAARVMAIDRAPGTHTAWLGRWLGYPACCTRAAGRVGEDKLDALADRLGRRRFIGQFDAINVAGYREGKALISHIPCAPNCAASLKLAKMLKKVEYPGGRSRWRGLANMGQLCMRRSSFPASTKRRH